MNSWININQYYSVGNAFFCHIRNTSQIKIHKAVWYAKNISDFEWGQMKGGRQVSSLHGNKFLGEFYLYQQDNSS